MKEIVLAGGCFWGIEKFFSQFDGLKTEVGYANGLTETATYQQVCAGSGHTEAVRIEYPDSVSCAQLIAVLFEVIDPVSLNRQGNDVGINYRTGIYAISRQQESIAKAMIGDLQKHYARPIAVESEPLKHFIPAEDYHQKYLDKNPQGYCHLPKPLLSGHQLPELENVLQAYPSLKALI